MSGATTWLKSSQNPAGNELLIPASPMLSLGYDVLIETELPVTGDCATARELLKPDEADWITPEVLALRDTSTATNPTPTIASRMVVKDWVRSLTVNPLKNPDRETCLATECWRMERIPRRAKRRLG